MVAGRRKTPEGPGELSKGTWGGVLKHTFKQFNRDNLTDWAAALTYYAVLSLFPGIIVLTAILGLLGPTAIQTVIDTVNQVVPGQGKDILVGAIKELAGSRTLAGPLAILGLLGALWSASGYVGAFMRASNSIYGMPEGRPIWKTIPLRIALTIGIVVLLAACALGVVATGSVARRIGDLIGLGPTGILVWEIAKWPVIALLVSLAFALLYWVGPNVRQPGFKWLTPGGLVAVLLWVLASAGFALYVANFGSYNKTYGSLAGVIVFLVWLWISNLAVVLGAELDAELARGRTIEEGHAEDQEEPFLPPRDTKAMDDDEAASVAKETERS
ncbi:YihY/virulence factor BrkB family protein [Amycolatopsis mongoliensis]|uniref:YihY/virulence factor BrkB family protein n=1 Tax=Amycolatopsis mongoliensis TaxID=715475 RepID=A0A9Y2JL68_9PSEU|nr:YihY/virulence factor BrkB family protein [Amycolatopsis sp. 4-36]WIX99348.1 YihY/virulence factor BrkB family protein [Amycolatopsis sp. 4-36]